MTTTHINRKPKGTKTGGQFAPSQNPEATLDLAPAAEPRPKVDFAQRQQELLEQLSDGVAALTSSDEWRRHLDFQSRFHNYSFGNTILIAIQRPDASRVAGFNTWKSMGRNVNKGEKAMYILAPMISKTKPKDDDEESKTFLRGFRSVPVFDVSQTSGDDLPEIVTKLDGDDVAGHYATLCDVASGMGYTVEDHEFSNTANGDTDTRSKSIRIESRNSPAQRVKTLVHELAHATLHEDLTDYHEHRGVYELEAESVAYVVCQTLGLDTSDYSFGYVAHWARDGENAQKNIKASGQRIQKTSSSLIEALSKHLDLVSSDA